MPKPFFLVSIFLLIIPFAVIAQQDSSKVLNKATGKSKVQYGLASFYSNKFNGRKTASGELFSQQKLTAAHNSLALGTYVRVTNLRNGKAVVVKINDRLHHRNKRIIDLTRTAAARLGFINSGLTQVKIEVLGKKPPAR